MESNNKDDFIKETTNSDNLGDNLEVVEDETSTVLKGGADVAEIIKKLRAKLKNCQKERDDYLIGWQRAKADLINARRRDEEDRKNFVRFANERLFADLLPILDSFDIAMGNKSAWEKVDKGWRDGVEYIYKDFVKVLENHGLKQYRPAVGDKFDALKHESIELVATDDAAKIHTIVEVVKSGYELGDQVFRPAQVKIFGIDKNSKQS
jgi:molecular chaperone GrpE